MIEIHTLIPSEIHQSEIGGKLFWDSFANLQNHQNNLNEGYPRCQVLPKSDPIKLPWLPFSYFYLPTILSQLTNQSSLR